MLVLTRKSEEKIVIGEEENEIVITVLGIQGDRVRLGVEANRETPVYRKELLRKKAKDSEKGSHKSEELENAGEHATGGY
jgi:carbon storage regulator